MKSNNYQLPTIEVLNLSALIEVVPAGQPVFKCVLQSDDGSLFTKRWGIISSWSADKMPVHFKVLVYEGPTQLMTKEAVEEGKAMFEHAISEAESHYGKVHEGYVNYPK